MSGATNAWVLAFPDHWAFPNSVRLCVRAGGAAENTTIIDIDAGFSKPMWGPEASTENLCKQACFLVVVLASELVQLCNRLLPPKAFAQASAEVMTLVF